jgi:hypothetical protein
MCVCVRLILCDLETSEEGAWALFGLLRQGKNKIFDTCQINVTNQISPNSMYPEFLLELNILTLRGGVGGI